MSPGSSIMSTYSAVSNSGNAPEEDEAAGEAATRWQSKQIGEGEGDDWHSAKAQDGVEGNLGARGQGAPQVARRERQAHREHQSAQPALKHAEGAKRSAAERAGEA